ncbi:MAG TPA: 50S ribosomal protein L18 [Gemmatimonadaceae bacterium]|nr:50S ribosomal protein L18 [Gemmatimonadaceae bacterium]
MRPPKTNEERRYRRHLRVRKKVSGTAERPRLVIRRSLKHIYAQLVDDTASRTLMTVSSHDIEGKKTVKSTEVGKRIAARAKEAGISRVVFDRAGYRYHGRVKALADGAREGGLEF